LISLLLPYWNRPEAAYKAVESLKKHYSGLDMEVIVVDDGSSQPFGWKDDGLNVRVITLPKKDEPKSPVTCWNVAAKEAKGDILVISCIEVIHESPILEELTRDLGENEYRIASAWCPESRRWHTHSTVHVPDLPNGVGLGFCAALRKDLYWKAGGWDEAYREGSGYEDRDFLKRLLKVGAEINIRDDLKVIHPKTDAQINWGGGKFLKNLAIYRDKWPAKDVVTFVCVNSQNYLGLGAVYVNNLAEGVRKNMPDGVNWRFVCITDNASGLTNGIEVISLPMGVKGWWGKLYLFKSGLFPKDQRVIFLDLDTLITGDLSEIIKYDGEMAILRDFYFPERGAPAVIAFRSGFGHQIWDEWEAEGRPERGLGDLEWIENLDQGRFTRNIDRLQDRFPGAFVSYKADCKNGLPEGTKVVCFHGKPRPHEVLDTWVGDYWKMSGEKQKLMDSVQLLIDTEKYQEALAELNARLDENPNNMTALFQFGEVLLKLDKVGLATNIYRYLSIVVPDRPEIWNNLGRCYQTRATSKDARACFKKALELDNNLPSALVNLAILDVNEGKPDRAAFLAGKALEFTPDSRQALDVRAMGKLAIRDWSGWEDYLRSEGPPYRKLRQYRLPAEPEWMGESGKTVVIYREQGLGDEILFASCVEEASKISEKVILDVDKRLVGLFQRSFPQVDVYGTGYETVMEWPKNYDVDASAPIGRLPLFFRKKDSDFPGTPYLKACPFRKKAYRAMLDSLGKGPKVGIAWTGGKRSDSTTRADAEYRSLSLEDFAPLMKEGHHYISLEYKNWDDVKASGLPIHEWPWITQSQDYDDTAALVDELDYIIAVPTTVVHLAGALGKTCYCLTPEFSNWRFGMEGNDMIWHKSVKQFRGKDRVGKLVDYLNKPSLIKVIR